MHLHTDLASLEHRILSYSSLQAPFHSWLSPQGFRTRTSGILPDTVGVSTSTYRQYMIAVYDSHHKLILNSRKIHETNE